MNPSEGAIAITRGRMGSEVGDPLQAHAFRNSEW